MTTDQELSDKLVALGEPFPELASWISNQMSPYTFARDWRVAGAIMERLGDVFEITRVGDMLSLSTIRSNADVIDESLPGAIIEAGITLLEESM